MTPVVAFALGVVAGLAAHKAAEAWRELAAALGTLSDPYAEGGPVVYTTKQWGRVS